MRWTIAIAALGMSIPAQAQIAPRHPPSVPGTQRSPDIFNPQRPFAKPTIRRELGSLRERIDAGREHGGLSRREARELRREAGRIGSLAHRASENGLTDSELREIDTRLTVLRTQIEAQRGIQKPGKR